LAELSCEACRKAPANNGDILCADCTRLYVILVDLLREHPELAKDDMARLRELFDWRNRREQEWLKNIFRGPTAKEKAPFQTTK